MLSARRYTDERSRDRRGWRARRAPGWSSLPAWASRDVGKRLLLGRKLRSAQLGETLLPKRIALPVFASDALSSVAYAPDEIFLTLSAGRAGRRTSCSWKIGIVRRAGHARGGRVLPAERARLPSPAAATTRSRPSTSARRAGLTVASALLVDYVLTVAVSISSAAQYAASADRPARRATRRRSRSSRSLFLHDDEPARCPGVGHGVRDPDVRLHGRDPRDGGSGASSGYFFGDLPEAESADFTSCRRTAPSTGSTGLALVFLLLRAFSSGCAALTGVEAISNGVPAFRKPKSKNAATTLLLLGTHRDHDVARRSSILGQPDGRAARRVTPATELIDPRPAKPVGASYDQDPVIGQLAKAIFDHFPLGFYLVAAATGVILVLAANTAFNGFPVLGSILARDGYLPRQLHTRGDRLAFSNGIVLLAGFAIVLIVAFDAEVTRLIQLYIVGVFVSFTLSQTGMVRHWTRLLRTEHGPGRAARMIRSRGHQRDRPVHDRRWCWSIVLITKFTHGAWIAILAMAVLFLHDEGHPAALRPRRPRAGRRRGRRRSLPVPGPRDRAGLEGAQADAARARLRPRRPARTRSRRSPSTSTRRPREQLLEEWDAARHPGPAARCSTRRTARSPGRSSTTSATSGGAARATW